MRFPITLAAVLLMSPAMADDRVSGPASDSISKYLESTTQECPSDPDRKCSLKSLLIDARTFYGHFPGDPSQYAVAFVDLDSGGSGADQEAMIWKAAEPNRYTFVGQTTAIGADARDVHFFA